jgi:8-oxo-dGTP pyrophosphatase MutT (NUDIX family)
VASRADSWRQRIERGLAAVPTELDPKSTLLANVIGAPSVELEALLAGPSQEAAVLVGLVERAGGVAILLTERASHLAHHPGQISFPGGRLNGPGEDHVTAAIREANEEVGLAAHQVDVLGRLPPRLTGTGFAVTPIVGWLAASFEAEPDPAEVQSAFEVPIEHLLEPANRRQTIRERYGSQFLSYEFHFERHRIWGATAAILAELFEVINEKTIS